MNELRIRRLIIEDDQGRSRAVIECGASPDPPGDGGVSLTMFAATGDPMITAEIDHDGQPRLSVGHPDGGASLYLFRSELQVWEGGNEVAILGAANGGNIVLRSMDAATTIRLPPGK